MSTKKEYIPSLKVHLVVYQLPLIIDPISARYQKLFSKWNHCAIQADNIVIHFYDDLAVPRWTDLEADLRLTHPRQSLFIGDTDMSIGDLRTYTNALTNMRYIDYVTRYLSPLGMFYFPKKKNDCIHKCSLTLNHIFGFKKVITSTPDKLLQEMKWKLQT